MNQNNNSIKQKIARQVIIFLFAGFVCSLPHSAAAKDIETVGAGTLLTLSDALARSLQNDLRVKAAIERLGKEEALYQGSLKEFLPKLTADGFASFASGDKHFVSLLDAGISEPIFRGGKTVFEKNRQKAVFEAEKLKVEETKLDLELGLRTLYAEVLREKELTRIGQEKVKVIEREEEKARTVTQGGALPRHELFKIQNLLEESKSALISHKESYDYLLGVLKDSTGITGNESLELEPWNSLPPLEENASYYLALSKGHDPVYQLKDLLVRQKEYEKKALQSERFPQLDLVAKWNRFDDVYLDTNRVLAGIEGKWDIWDFGRLGAKIKAKSHEIEEQKCKGNLLLKEHEQEILRTFHALRSALGKIRSTETLVLEREEFYKNEKAKLIAGQKSSLDFLESYAALEEARVSRLQAISDYRILAAKLARKTSFDILRSADRSDSESGENLQ